MSKLKITNPRHMAVLKIVNDNPLATKDTVLKNMHPKPTREAAGHILTKLVQRSCLNITAQPGRSTNQYTINDKGKEQIQLWDASNDK